MLQSIATYTSGAGSVNTLSDLGLTLSQAGQMSFNASAFSAASTDAIQQFLGSATTGGFLQTATNDLLSVTNATSGIMQTQENTLQAQIASDNSQIAQQQTIITDLQNNLTQQLSAADAAIATLQAQDSYFQQLFTATYGTNGTTTTG
jgi:flagellar capping protein FliD